MLTYETHTHNIHPNITEHVNFTYRAKTEWTNVTLGLVIIVSF